MKQAKDHQLRVRGYISCVIECPYTGPIAPPQVALLAKRFLEIGCDEISLGDTIGKGTPLTIKNLLEEIRQEVPMDKIAIHCHDTYGRAMDNILTALEMGVQVIDSAMGGLGGCPYAGTEAKGNIATEELVSTLQRKGYLQGFDTPFFAQASAFVAAKKKNLL
jgi:hydroxymethylglutaryl-CoA lyase